MTGLEEEFCVKVNENRIAPESEYFVYSPSAVARNTFSIQYAPDTLFMNPIMSCAGPPTTAIC